MHAVKFLDSGFMCGMCHKSYDDMMQARCCLYECLKSHGAKVPFKTVRSGAKSVEIRCSICNRVYPDQEDASRCSRSCRAELEVKIRQIKRASENS